MAGIDDDVLLGDLLGDTALDLELEARFQELEQRAALDEAYARLAEAERRARASARGTEPPPSATADDPLKDLKAAFEAKPEAQTTEYLLVLCPSASCGRKNRLDRARALTAEPRCGACGAALVFTR
ncbi:MAG: hypothetical protein CVU56_14385 [Deltaproteobacteria bacterium HGW-Deltaproteobacteria-14]|jgi:hypothetical protein|nr:MAG: hypothetical protein CVU56_14385 [Deltaproteobacteria bacterium HGW-Deltaproteobacteria-14]